MPSAIYHFTKPDQLKHSGGSVSIAKLKKSSTNRIVSSPANFRLMDILFFIFQGGDSRYYTKSVHKK